VSSGSVSQSFIAVNGADILHDINALPECSHANIPAWPDIPPPGKGLTYPSAACTFFGSFSRISR